MAAKNRLKSIFTTAGLPCIFIIVTLVMVGCAAKGPQRFESPEEGVERLTELLSKGDTKRAERIFGPEGRYLLHSGDEVLDRERVNSFTKVLEEGYQLVKQSDESYMLEVGARRWPFPVPLVSDGESWVFDAVAGRGEILARRIGENELRVMTVASAVAQAQRVYASYDHDGDGVRCYATRLISTPGKRDGLYWPQSDGAPRSPLAAVVAHAESVGMRSDVPQGSQPYYGYFFRLITEPPAGEGERGSYWLLAYPAEPGQSGVMLFASNERGWIYETPSPSDPRVMIEQLGSFALDESWQRVW